MSALNKAFDDLTDLILQCDAQYPGNTELQMKLLLGLLAHGITNKLFDAATMATLRAGQWPESIQRLLAAGGAS